MHIHYENIQPNCTITMLHKEAGYAHWHQRVEFVYILNGSCEITVGNTKNVCSAGDMAVIQSGEIHSIVDIQDSAMYVCTFDPELIRYFRADMKYIQNYISTEMLTASGVADEILRNFEEMYKEDFCGKDWNDVLIRANIIKMYCLLVRHFERDNNGRPQNPDKLQQFQEALRYVEENYARNITFSDVAKIINYNTSYASSLFVSYTGLNFKTYLDSIRINKAVKMIKRTDRTISDISAQCGFTNIRTFNNVFRKVTGITPSELRHSNS